MIRKLFFILPLIVFASACTQEDDFVNTTTDETAEIPVPFTTAVAAETRAEGTAWNANDSIGIYMMDASASSCSAAIDHNIQYNISGSGANVTLYPPYETIFFPSDGSAVKFVAYYPYNEHATETEVPVNVADQSNQAKIDVMLSRSSSTYTKQSTSVALPFTHRLSKVIISITRDASMTTPIGDIATVTIGGMPTTATLSLNDGTLSELDNVADIVAKKSAFTESTATFEALLIPNGNTYSNRTLTFDFSGITTYTYNIGTQAFESGKVYTYNFTLKGNKVENGGQTEDDAEEVNIEMSAESNCYIVAPNSEVRIPMSRIASFNASALSATDVSFGASEAFTAEVFWTDAPGSTTSLLGGNIASVRAYEQGTAGSIIVKTGSKAGNALVVAKNASGVVLWSWHIWVTEYDPAATAVTYSTSTNSAVWMDRNVGALDGGLDDNARGLYYQWGRPTPFMSSYPAPNKAFAIKTSTSATLNKALQNPNEFYYETKTGNWMKSGEYGTDNWGAVSNAKTVLDPCPEGWRMPVTLAQGQTNSLWYNLAGKDVTAAAQIMTPGSGGYTATVDDGKILNWSAAGHLLASTGELTYAGAAGYYWSAKGVTSKAYRFGFADSSIEGLLPTSFNKANGCTVRCIKE
ncbi:MAG: fimbrillin family protein [Prevotellaceae bacterium]|jgi:uncharacterized protein (TIGR02145 family)|nr:fimbrillin family protein [Prevotellaceae bacterium]